MTNEDLRARQDEVSRRVGRCVLRLQQYERQLKAIVAVHDIGGAVDDPGSVASLTETARQTLGTLVQAFVSSVLVGGEPAAVEERDAEDKQGPLTFRMTMRLGMTGEDLSRTKLDLRELVQIRNDLIHHFMERHDLWSLDGCRIALEELDLTLQRIGADLARLREWAAILDLVRREAGACFRSDECVDAVVNGIYPDGTVFWPGAGIVVALREAAEALTVDGWTEVSAAKRWIAERYPHQTPERYGCTTYPQVLHASGEFDLCRLEKDGLARRHYRLRAQVLRKGGGHIARPTTPPHVKA